MPTFIPDQPYDLPALPPNVDVESRVILKACIEARAALAKLDQAARAIPNPSVLINTLPLLEAQDSSRIENIVTTTDDLFRYANIATSGADSGTREALRYRTALYEGFRSLADRPLSTNTAITVCSTIKNTDMSIRRVPGTQLANDQTGEIIYTPPLGEDHLRNLLSNWERYLHNDDNIDPLIRMAVSHYQFEAIHPFTDGNGRTGRILNLLFLVQAQLLHMPVLYLSRYINKHKNDYYDLLISITRDHDWEPWILFILEGVRLMSHWTSDKIAAIQRLQLETADVIRVRLPSIYSYELVDLLFVQPYCRINNLVEAEIVQRQAAGRYLGELVSANVLTELKVGREKMFINTRLMTLLTTDHNEYTSF